MEIITFLKENEIKVDSSAKSLTKMLDNYMENFDFEKSFKRIAISRSGEAMTPKSFVNFTSDNLEKIKQIESKVNSLRAALAYVIGQIIGFKEQASNDIKAKRVEQAAKIPDYYDLARSSLVPVDLFDVVDYKTNEHDRKLYKCFKNAGEHIVFCSKDTAKLITQDKDGALVFGNDLISMDEQGLYKSICEEMKQDYLFYKNVLVERIASLNTDDLDPETIDTPVIEKIFLEDVPCSFKFIVNICKKFSPSGDGNGLRFDGFVVKPNKKVIESLDFDSFLTALSKNFLKMTRNALSHQDEYKAFSNDINDAAVTHWILPSESCLENATCPKIWQTYLKGKAEPRILQRVLWYIGAMQDAHNYAEQALLISDGGGTGKSILLEILWKLFPPKMFGYINNSIFNDNKEFALSERKLWENHVLVLDEYDGNSINNPMFKNLLGTKTPLSMSVKNKQAVTHNFKGTKMIICSNEVSKLSTHSFRRRIIPVSFSINHKGAEAFSQADIDKLVETGPEFLKYCFKIYRKCRCVKPNGEYYVLEPEREKALLEGKYPDEKEELLSMKAISQDEAISEYFNVFDYDDSDTSIELSNVIADLFEITGDNEDTLTQRELIKYIELKLDQSDDIRDDLHSAFFDIVDKVRNTDGELVSVINIHKKGWWIFKQCLEKAGAVFKQARVDGRSCKVVFRVKIKEDTI